MHFSLNSICLCFFQACGLTERDTATIKLLNETRDMLERYTEIFSKHIKFLPPTIVYIRQLVSYKKLVNFHLQNVTVQPLGCIKY